MPNFIADHHGHSGSMWCILAQVLMHVHPLGSDADLLATNKMCFVAGHKSSLLSKKIHRLMHILLYVHYNGGTIDLLVPCKMLSHFVTGYHGLPSAYVQLHNTISDACTPSWVCY